MKRLLTLLLTALALTPPLLARDFQYDGIKYTIIDETAKTCETTEGYSRFVNDSQSWQYEETPNKSIAGDLVIPSKVKNGKEEFTVTKIAAGSFVNCKLTSISIPSSVTEIGEQAFDNCRNLTKFECQSIEWLLSVKFNGQSSNPLSFAHHLFINGEEITQLLIPTSITSIGDYAFVGWSALTSISIPNSVTSIGRSAFYNCSGLISVTIPNSVTSIDTEYIFYGCSSLTSVRLPASTTSIGTSMFHSCSNLTSIEIPNSVTRIEDWAFKNCTNLASITISNSVTTIGHHAFAGCSSLTSVSIPNSVKSIGTDAFDGCSNLTIAEFADIESLCSMAFLNEYPDDLHPAGYRMGNWKSNPLSIAHHLYINGKEITDLTIPNSVTTIGHHAFSGCSGLTSVSIPNSVNSIGVDAFNGCTNLTKAEFAGIESLCSMTFLNEYEYDYGNGIIINGHWTSNPLSIAHHLYINGKEITDLIIPNSVTTIGDHAFFGCSGLTSVSIPRSVTTISPYALSSCTNLKTITIPESVTEIGEGILAGVELESLDIFMPFRCYINDGQVHVEGYNSSKNKYVDFGCTVAQANSYRNFCRGGQDYVNFLDFLQPEDVKTLIGGAKIDFSSRLNEMKERGLILRSLTWDGQELSPQKEGVYLAKGRGYHSVSMCCFDPRLGNDISTTYTVNSTAEIFTISDFSTTQTTAEFEFAAKKDESVDGYSEFMFSYGGESKTVKKEGKVKLSGLTPNREITITPTAKTKDGLTISGEPFTLKTKGVAIEGPTVKNLSPTSYEVVWRYDAGDATVNETRVTPQIEGYSDISVRNGEARLLVWGRTPNTNEYVNFTVDASGNSFNAPTDITLPALELTTIAARATSNDCAIICAETNMSEDETGGGFEWRRYDAPDLVPSTFVACPVANGHMEGKLKGLSSGTYYKYRPYYEDAEGTRTFGEWTAFGTADAYVYFEPTVYTYAPTNITSTGAELRGYALAGSDDVTEQGFEYRAVAQSRAAEGEVQRVVVSGQRMRAQLDNLQPSTTYSVRTFATTAKGTTYGDEMTFTTAEDPQGGIETVESTSEVTTERANDVYTLQGMLVRRNATADDLRSLRPGLYIIGGRKVLVR